MGRIWEKRSLRNRERKTTNKFRFVLVFLLLLSVGLAFIGITSATTIHVPDNYPTIQQAVDNAMEGDTIIVHSGTYYEHVSIHKSLTIIGDGAIIDAGGEFQSLSMCSVTSGNIRGFTVQNGAIGIDLSHASNVNIEGNTALNTLVGFHLWDSNNNNIKNNVAQGSEYSGISIHGGYEAGGSNYNTITDNELSNNDAGIDIYISSNYNEITNNIIMSNKYEGIYIHDSCDRNTITDNEVLNNDVGIYIEDSGNNLIHHNNLINNSQSAYDDMGTNFWDNGYPSGGNYWSDYEGEDKKSGQNQDKEGSDEIGDTPYYISGDACAQDSYPLMQPWSVTPQKGDLDCDGNVTTTDAAIALSMAVRGEYTAAADVSDDNRVTSLDALMILQAAAGNVAEKTHLRIGYLPSTHQLAEMVAMEKGWWEEDLAEFGITEVTDHQFPSGPPEMQSMMAGNLDVAYVGVAPSIFAIAQGLDAKIVAAVQTQGSDLMLRPDIADSYTSPSDLCGLKIATFPLGSVMDIVLKKFLMDNSVSIDDVEIVPMDPGNATTAIASGTVDGVFLPHPCPAMIELEGNGVSVVSSGEMWTDHACCCLVVSGDLIRNHPDLVNEIVRTHIKATEYVNGNQTESAEIFAEKIEYDLDTVEYSFEHWDGEWISDPHLELECTIEFANISYDLEYIDRLLTAEDLFDTSFYDEVTGK